MKGIIQGYSHRSNIVINYINLRCYNKFMIQEFYKYLLRSFLIIFVFMTLGIIALNSIDNCTDDGCSEFQTTISNHL
jgi:hypothetical protein